VIAIGDAVGHCHPLTAIGLTQGFLDAEAAAADAARTYPGERVRESYAAELVANSLYNVLRRDDRCSSAIRSAIYDAWRTNRALRELSIQLLIGSARQPVDFALILGQLSAAALRREVRDVIRSPRRAVARVAAFRGWLPWGVSAVMPEVLRATYREHAKASAPVPGLSAITDPAEPVSVVPSREVDRDTLARARAAAATALNRVASALCATDDDIRWLTREAQLRDEQVPLDGDRLVRAAHALVGVQARDGAFGDPITTELACRALRLAPTDETIDHALKRAASWLRGRQTDDGAQPGPDPIANTAASIEAWLACGIPATDPVVRRAVRWLVRKQAANGTWQDETDVLATLWTTARAVNALAVASYFRGARELGTAMLVELVSALLENEGDGASLRDAQHAPILAELLRALASADRADSHLIATRSRPVPGAREEDVEFCQEALGQVSRTFVRPIGMLPEQLSIAVTCGYLLCRIADTIEDHPCVPPAERERMFGVFLDTLAGATPGRLAHGFEAIPGEDAELALGRNCARVMRVLESLHPDQRAACRRWIAEMVRGMNVYVQRPPGDDQITALTTLADLERYCYFVAGTVGHLLTDLFAGVFEGSNVLALRADAERFGSGLQMVNILKDIAEDRARGWSYIPRSVCAEEGLEVSELLDVARCESAHAAVAPVFAMAREHLDGALRYALAVPPVHTGVRLFCLLPLWMAVRTLVLARGNDAMFEPGAEVKISRAEVENLTSDVLRIVADDQAIALRYMSLWEIPS
jgi:farnesyl-diphosphate farnesyltransferase